MMTRLLEKYRKTHKRKFYPAEIQRSGGNGRRTAVGDDAEILKQEELKRIEIEDASLAIQM